MDQVPGCMVTGARAQKGWKCRAKVAAPYSCTGLDWPRLLMNIEHQETGESSLHGGKVYRSDLVFFQWHPPSLLQLQWHFFSFSLGNVPAASGSVAEQGDMVLGGHSFWTDFSLTLLTVDALPTSTAHLPLSLSPEQPVCASPAQPSPLLIQHSPVTSTKPPARCQLTLAEERGVLLI